MDEEEGLVRFEVRQPRAAPRAQLAFTDASLSKLIVILVLATGNVVLQRPGELARPLTGRAYNTECLYDVRFSSGHPRCDRDLIVMARDQKVDSIRRIDGNDEPIVRAECGRRNGGASWRRDRTVEVTQDDRCVRQIVPKCRSQRSRSAWTITRLVL